MVDIRGKSREALLRFAVAVVVLSQATPADAYPCQRLLWAFGLVSRPHDPIVSKDGVTIDTPPNSDGRPFVNGVLVSGADDYPLSVLQHHLGLEKTNMPKLAGKTLSIGEGYSQLLPALVAHGNDAYAVDLWYGNEAYPNTWEGSQMKAFDAKHRERLIRGDATKIPAVDGAYDNVLSHELVNNVDAAKQEQMVREAVRVTARGGTARIFGFKEADAQRAATLLRGLYGDAVVVTTEKKGSEYFHPYKGKIYVQGYLLVVEKVR